MNMNISVQDLVNSGIIRLDDVKTVALMRRQEVLMQHNVETPKILSRMKGGTTKYYCNVPSKYSKNGCRHQITGDTPEEVEAAFQVEAYENFTHDEMTVQELVEICIKDRRPELKLGTYERYHNALTAGIHGSKFGQLKINNIKLTDCEAFIRSLYTKKYALATIKVMKTVLSVAFDYGIAHEYITTNYMNRITINKNCCLGICSHSTGAWTNDEIKAMWEGSIEQWNQHKQYRLSAAMMFLIFSGLRGGELMSLTKSDINWSNRQVIVNKTTVYCTDDVGAGRIVIDSPKTAESRRVITLNDAAIFWLQEIQRRNEASGIESDLVVPSLAGKLLKLKCLNDSVNAFCRKIGVEYHSSHAGRRTYVSIALDNPNIPVASISRDLGHKNPSTTMNIYYKIRQSENELLEKKNLAFAAVACAADFLASPGINHKNA